MDHFELRWKQRFGYALNKEERKQFHNTVRSSRKFIHRQENTTGTVYSVKHKGMNVVVVYDPLLDILITILPPSKNYKQPNYGAG
jgi:hypothetical protein